MKYILPLGTETQILKFLPGPGGSPEETINSLRASFS